MNKSSAINKEVKPPESGELIVPDYIQCLQRALGRRDHACSVAILMGLSGEAFRFFFSGSNPLAGLTTVGHNPLRAAAIALGYDCSVKSAAVAAAIALLSADLKDGKGPAILKTKAGWLVIEAEDAATNQFHAWQPGGGETKLTKAGLTARWPESAGLLELGTDGYYYFLLGEKSREGDIKEAATGAMRRAYRQLFRSSKVEGCSVGLNGYQELSRIISRKRRAAKRANDLYKYALWHTEGMPTLRAARKAAALFLEELRPNFTHEDEENLLLKALRGYK